MLYIPACPIGLADRTGVVKFSPRLELYQISADFEIEHFSKVSNCLHR